MQYYFAYGSNLHHAQMKRRCPNCRYIKKHILNGYQLTFSSKYGAFDIEKKTGKKPFFFSNISNDGIEDLVMALFEQCVNSND